LEGEEARIAPPPLAFLPLLVYVLIEETTYAGIEPLTISSAHPEVVQGTGKPTDVQEKAWPEISQGKHVLVTAPMGCGKTLASFLWALNQRG